MVEDIELLDSDLNGVRGKLRPLLRNACIYVSGPDDDPNGLENLLTGSLPTDVDMDVKVLESQLALSKSLVSTASHSIQPLNPILKRLCDELSKVHQNVQDFNNKSNVSFGNKIKRPKNHSQTTSAERSPVNSTSPGKDPLAPSFMNQLSAALKRRSSLNGHQSKTKDLDEDEDKCQHQDVQAQSNKVRAQIYNYLVRKLTHNYLALSALVQSDKSETSFKKLLADSNHHFRISLYEELVLMPSTNPPLDESGDPIVIYNFIVATFKFQGIEQSAQRYLKYDTACSHTILPLCLLKEIGFDVNQLKWDFNIGFDGGAESMKFASLTLDCLYLGSGCKFPNQKVLISPSPNALLLGSDLISKFLSVTQTGNKVRVLLPII